MTVNVPLLRKAVEWVEQQDLLPDEERMWDQTDWVTTGVCGTTCCVAGWVALNNLPPGGRVADPTGMGPSEVHAPHTLPVSVASYARDLLGLDADSAGRLFYGGNDATDIRAIAEEIVGEAL
jgi:hypothetical protein